MFWRVFNQGSSYTDKKDLVSKADRSSKSGINELQKAPKAFRWQIHCATTFFKSDNAAAATREKKNLLKPQEEWKP